MPGSHDSLNQRYPIDLWESIIDSCNDPDSRSRANYPALRACALVCRQWRSRSQFRLLQTVSFSKATQVDLLLQTIELRPAFADCIHGIAIDDNADGYIPFAHPALRRLGLRACRKLDLSAVDWTDYPSTILGLFPLFTGITDLGLSFDRLTYSAAFRVITAIPGLRTLAITGIGKNLAIRGTVGEDLGALAFRRKQNVCVELKTLVINEPFLSLLVGFPPRGAFGEAITCIQLQVYRRHGISDTMRGFIYGGLPQLDSLHVSILEGPRPKGHGLGHTFTGLSSVLPRPGDVFRGRVLRLSLPFDSSYGASRTEFLNVLHEALLARAQRLLKAETEGCFHCNHASTRCETPLPCERCRTLHLVSTCIPTSRSRRREVTWRPSEREGSRVPYLDELHVCVGDDDATHDHRWWTRELKARFPFLLSVTTEVKFAKPGTGSKSLWEPEGRDTSNWNYHDESEGEGRGMTDDLQEAVRDAEREVQREAARRAEREARRARREERITERIVEYSKRAGDEPPPHWLMVFSSMLRGQLAMELRRRSRRKAASANKP